MINIEEREKEIDKLTQELYKQNREIRPLYPWVLVRVCQREQKVGSIVVPDIEQNKPVHEGIVLATWKPFTKELGESTDELLIMRNRTDDEKGVLIPQGSKFTRSVEMRSALEPGQHVLFPHWAGMPVAGFSDKRYRMVKEMDWEINKEGGIFAVVDYSPVEVAAKAKLRAVLEPVLNDLLLPPSPAGHFAVSGAPCFDTPAALLAALIEEQFVLVDRDLHAVTLSGR